jgi:hypothetical protein
MIRKRYRVLILAVLVAAIAVPLGFALSLETTPAVVVASPTPDIAIMAATARSHAMVVQASAPRRTLIPTLPDGAKLLFVGSALFGLAGVMRRTN